MNEPHIPNDLRIPNGGERLTDVLVVGGGIAGLVAAIEASKTHSRVTVLEARRGLGGRGRTTESDGFLLNEGPHALYRTGAAWRTLGEFGIDLPGGEPDVATAVGVDGPLVGAVPAGPLSLLRSPIIKGGRLRFGKLFASLGRIDVEAYQSMTVDEAIVRLAGDGRAAALLESLFRLSGYSNDPGVASAGPLIQQLRDAADTPVRYLDGGWREMVSALGLQADKRGIEVRTGVKVDAVLETDDGVEVRAGDTSWTAQTCVVAGLSPSALAGILPAVPPPVEEWIKNARPATAATLDVGLSQPWGDGPTIALGLDKPLYLSVHAPVARLAPEGASLVHVMRYQHPDEELDSVRDRADCEALLERVRPGWRDTTAHVGFNRRLVAAHDQPQASRGGYAGRPAVAVPDHKRVFVAGDWVGPEGLLVDAVFASARGAALEAASVTAS